MTLYNVTALANATNVFGLFTAANQYSNNLMFNLFVLAMFFIMVMSFRNRPLEDNLIVSTWLCFILSLIFSYAHLTGFIWTLAYLIAAGLSVLFKVTTRRE